MIGVSHLGLCVSDLDRAAQFYIQALGAIGRTRTELSVRMPPIYRKLVEIPDDMDASVQFIELDGTLIELICFARGGAGAHLGRPERRPMNLLGYTHLGLRIEDINAYAAIQDRIRTFGGSIVENTRLRAIEFEGQPIESVFALDPDGTRLELMRMPPHYPIGGTLWHPRTLDLARGK
jgi:catechol 2,3-dioxygenase-like lactoylglutathione lyase family enzyme